MNVVVVDASAALSWLLPSQATPATSAFLTHAARFVFAAPFVFEWEVCNVLLSKLRAGRLTHHQFEAALEELRAIGVEVADPFRAELVSEVAREEGLSLFDAAYLATARELAAAVVSRDADLLRACARNGVPTFDLAMAA